MKEKVLTALKRVFKSGLNSFWRNRWVSSATISVMVITIGLITSLFLVSVMADKVLKDLEQKIDVSVYFSLDTSENEVLKIKQELEGVSDVKSVEYVSKEMALAKFEEDHKNNPQIIKSLEELGGNPLEASLNVKAKYIENYDAIVSFLESSRFSNTIDTVNYRQNQKVIEKLSSILSATRRFGFVGIMVLVLIAILVTFNTIRITIYSTREEIGIMRLVGASNWYIRGPFIVEGIAYGLVAAVVTLILFYPLILFVSPKISAFINGLNLADYFSANVLGIFLMQSVIGVGLGVISSLIAMRRYLKI